LTYLHRFPETPPLFRFYQVSPIHHFRSYAKFSRIGYPVTFFVSVWDYAPVSRTVFHQKTSPPPPPSLQPATRWSALFSRPPPAAQVSITWLTANSFLVVYFFPSQVDPPPSPPYPCFPVFREIHSRGRLPFFVPPRFFRFLKILAAASCIMFFLLYFFPIP